METSRPTEVHGHWDQRFHAVVEQFQQNFVDQGDIGAALCIYKNGDPVIDVWGGLSDRATRTAWAENTIVPVFSATKGITATCVHLLAQRGDLNLEHPVARYWPEFAAQEKERITIRDVLSHRAGLAAVDATLTNEEIFAWYPVVDAIGRQKPNWTPASEHGYHARSFGWILGEIVRRVSGKTIGAFIASELVAPLEVDFHVGLPPNHQGRVATLYPPPSPTDPQEIALRERFMGPSTLLGKVLGGPGDLAYGDVWNSPALHAAEMPSSNGIGSARSLAKLYASLLGLPGREPLLRPDILADATRPISVGPDKVIMVPTRFASGFMLPPVLARSCPPSCFGHPGAGGSLAFADPEQGLAFGFVVNAMKLGISADERAEALIRLAYSA